jgi:outer membrane lipoprotein-sorting protein
LKRLFVFFLLIVLALSGCSGAKPVPKNFMTMLSNGFECRMSVNYDKNSYQIYLQKSNATSYKISIEKPTILNGFIFKSENSNISITYNGLGINIDQASLPQSAFAQVIFGVLDSAINSKQITYKVFSNRIEMYGETSIGKYTIKLDKKSFKPVSISVPSVNLNIQISDFNLNNQS